MDAFSTQVASDNFAACENEPIRIPGSIQPHGFFVGVHAEHGNVIQVSENLADWTGKTVEASLGQPFSELVGQDIENQLFAILSSREAPFYPMYLGPIALGEGNFFDVLAHPQAGMTVFEFESTTRNAHGDFLDLYPLVGTFLSKLRDVSTVLEMSDLAAKQIKQLTGYGRVLVYRFDEDGHGHVLAEAKDESYQSYLNQRFPASDIPRQARELYVTNRMRLIRDANYAPVKLVPANHPLTGEPNDLTHSVLRSVSPIHVRYMKNMGTMASMSVSILIKGKLWGLISCHNTDPKPVSFESRAACEQLGQILALRIESKEDSEEAAERLELRRMLVEMLGPLGKGTDFVGNIEGISHQLLRFAKASGAALIFGGDVYCFGDTPTRKQTKGLVEWLNLHTNGIYHTDSLSSEYPRGEDLKDKASGILALPISRLHNHYLIWFRPEVIQTIDWAGNPHLKTASNNPDDRLSPRVSFSLWRETVSGRSLPWQASEVGIASEFHAALLGLVLERAEQMAELAEELGRANKELEAFSYSVSHDLRAPMRHIVGYADLLLEFEGKHLEERSNRFLNNIKESARFAGRLVDDLLSFSQMGRAALHVAEVNMNELVKATIENLMHETGNRLVDWRISQLATINGDPNFLQPAFYNLLSNAVKYTREKERAEIQVWSEDAGDQWIFHVKDNGVGFPMEYVHKLFGVFQRLHRMEEFEGTGIGLANVRRIVERHGGRVWATSSPNEGAQFSFAIPKQIYLEEGEVNA